MSQSSQPAITRTFNLLDDAKRRKLNQVRIRRKQTTVTITTTNHHPHTLNASTKFNTGMRTPEKKLKNPSTLPRREIFVRLSEAEAFIYTTTCLVFNK